MAGIQLTGLASGLDSETIISQLLSSERAPRVQMSLRQAKEQARHDAFDDVRSKLTALKTAATGLRSAATWADTQAVSTSDATRATARRTGGAAAGGYDLDITRLASAEQHTYDFAASGAAQTLTVGGASVALAADATLVDAVSAINSSDDAGVYAVAVGGRLVLSAKATGATGAFTATGTSLTEDATKLRAGLDAQYTLDGVAKTSSTNVIADALPGVELTLRAKTTSSMSVTVGGPGADTDAIVSRLKTFVDAYNASVDGIRSRTTEKRPTAVTTTAQARAGALFGDTGLTSTLSSLRLTLGPLASLGLTTGAASSTVNTDSVAGKVVLDEAKLRDALASDPSAVKRTLGAITGTDGFAQSIEAVLDPLTQSGGVLDQRSTSSTSTLKSIADSLDRFDARMTSRETLLRRQFASLEGILSKSNSLASSLAGMLG